MVMQASILHPHTFVLLVGRMYLVVLVVVLSSTGKSDLPHDHDHRVSTQNNIITQTTIYPSFWSVGNTKYSQKTQIIDKSTSRFLMSSPSEYNKMKTLNTPSTSPRISTNSESNEYPMTKVTTNVDERTTTLQPGTAMSGGNYEVTLQTTLSPTPETLANVCDIDQLEVTSNPVRINASTHETYCRLLVNAPNNTAISISVLDSGINNVTTYFYTELLESQILNNSERIKLISLDNTPCVVLLQGNQFRFHFENTKMQVRICNKYTEKAACYGTVHQLIETTQCRITPYKSKIQTSQGRQTFKYGYLWWHRISVIITQFQAKCSCPCLDSCICTLGYRQWLSACTNISQDNNTPTADLVVYKSTMRGLSFDNTSLHAIQNDTFLGLEGVEVLILSNNRLSMFQPTVCQNLPQLKVLKLDNNMLENLTSELFTGPCKQQLLMLYLQSNKLTYLPHGLFKSTSNLSYLDLKQNRLVQLYRDLFSSLEVLHELWLGDNAISTLPVDAFDSLADLRTLDLSGNSIANLPVGVFDSLSNLQILDLSDNAILTLPVKVFDSLDEMRNLHLSSNSINTLPTGVFASLGVLITLDMSDNNISTLPVGVFNSQWLTTLDLSRNTIFTLPVGVFDSLSWLITLNLSGNDISTLPVGVFHSLGRLYFLNLSVNSITTLPVGVFDSLSRLRTLDLSDNKLLLLPDDVFIYVGTTQGLLTLNLRSNNISTLHAHVFDHLNELLTLDISYNSLSHTLPVGVFSMLGKLVSLNLCCNNLKIHAPQTFESLTLLKILDISKNRIKQFPPHLFKYIDKLILLNLCCNNLKTIASQAFESLTQLKILDISKNSIEQLPPHLLESTGNLLSLDISENNLSIIPVTLFRNLSRLIYLNMSKNSMTRLPSFDVQGQLQVLDVNENQITILKQVTFQNLKNLIFLSIAKNSITTLRSHVFFNLDNLEFINASYNAIQKIGSKVVSVETKLKIFDLRGNEMYKVAPHSFTSLANSIIIVDKYATCCFLNEENCISMKPRTEYVTCNRMLRDIVLRISVWVLGLSAFICNATAYCIRSRKQQANEVQTLLISHLALADLLMGANMLILAIADAYYGQYFPSYAQTWRQSFACKLAGFLSIFSSEGSVFFITLISIDRMLGTKYPLGGHRLEIKAARICVTLAWLMALLISAIPISSTSDKGNFYSISEVCIGVPIVRRHMTTFMNESTEINIITISSSPAFQYSKFSGEFIYTSVRDFSVNHLELTQNITYTIAKNAGTQVGSIYSIVVFIAVNFVCFVIVACCYVYIFIEARRTTERASRSQNRNDELRMAKKMFALVFTDFCCWVPLSFVCILTQSGVIKVSPEMYAWTVGFILPINSSINPFLYVLYETISNYLEKKAREKER